jgi:hypothetical protein
MNVLAVIRRLYKSYEESLAALVVDILVLEEKMVPDRQVFSKGIAEIKTNLDILNKAVYRVRKSEFTAKLAAADAFRDFSFDALVKRIDSDLARVRRPEVQNNAVKLDELIRQVGRTKIANYPEQSTQLLHLFDLFNIPEHSVLIDANGLREIYEDLKLAQHEFQTLWSARIEEPALQEKIPDLHIATDMMIISLENKLFKRLEILAEDSGEPYGSLIALINQSIAASEQIQRGRISRIENVPAESPPVKVALDSAAVSS